MYKIITFIVGFFLLTIIDSEAQTITLQASEGWLIYTHGGKRGHRYGPSIIINSDKSIDMWLASDGLSLQNLRYSGAIVQFSNRAKS